MNETILLNVLENRPVVSDTFKNALRESSVHILQKAYEAAIILECQTGGQKNRIKAINAEINIKISDGLINQQLLQREIEKHEQIAVKCKSVPRMFIWIRGESKIGIGRQAPEGVEIIAKYSYGKKIK